MAHKTHDTRAWLLRRVEYGESDLVLTLFTETLGRVSALARGAKKSQRRFGSALEPMHTLRVRLDERAGAELLQLREAKLETPRAMLLTSLERMEVAGRALGWVRRAAPPRTAEPAVWRALEVFFSRLELPDPALSARAELAHAGLSLLVAFGWGLDLARCVSCGKACPTAQTALVDVARGGLICVSCGGARLRLGAGPRARMIRAAEGESGVLEPGDVDAALTLIDRALSVHLGFE
ncbi:MAG: DNA repair protein RecO [Myxococcales bacterium]|nr:DNA repair protein RecO [Myxococcales bacterium]